MKRKKFSQKKKQKKPEKEAIKAPVVINTHFINRKLLIGFARFALSSLTILLLFFALQVPNSNKDNKVLGATSSSVFGANLNKKIPEAPYTSARSAIVVSTKKNKILFAKNPDLKLPPASTTKILTALLAISEFNLDEKIVVPSSCTLVEGTKMGLIANETINVESLLYGLLVASAGDAACTLSVHKFSSGTFIAKMNLLAKDIGLTNTNFTNPIGLDTDEVSHVSTARDLYLMTREALKNGVFRKIVGTKEVVLRSSDGKYAHSIRSTNKLLFELPGSLGVKTGTTTFAKEVLVYAYQYHDDEIIIVVMGSDDRFSDTKALLDFALANYGLF